MAHRYLYYVKGAPVISDRRYDQIEKIARTVLPSSSPVHSVGSDLESSYSERVRNLAKQLS